MPVQVDLLLVEEDRDALQRTQALLEASGFRVTAACTLPDAMDCLRHRTFDLVIADPVSRTARLADSWDGIDQLQAVSQLVPVGLITDAELATDEIARRGIVFALHKPTSSEQLLDAVAHCLALPAVSIERQATVRAYLSSLERSDWDRLAALCTADVVYRPPAHPELPGPGVILGREAFRGFAEVTFRKFPEPRFAVQRMRALPDGVLVRYEGTWLEHDHRSASYPGALLFRFEGQHIAEIGVSVDLRHGAAPVRAP